MCKRRGTRIIPPTILVEKGITPKKLEETCGNCLWKAIDAQNSREGVVYMCDNINSDNYLEPTIDSESCEYYEGGRPPETEDWGRKYDPTED